MCHDMSFIFKLTSDHRMFLTAAMIIFTSSVFNQACIGSDKMVSDTNFEFTQLSFLCLYVLYMVFSDNGFS